MHEKGEIDDLAPTCGMANIKKKKNILAKANSKLTIQIPSNNSFKPQQKVNK